MTGRITRKAAALSGAGLLALAGLGGVMSHTVVHAAGPTLTVSQPATSGSDTDQQDVTGADVAGTEAPDAAEAPGPDLDANAPCSGQSEATQTGNCDTQSQADVQGGS